MFKGNYSGLTNYSVGDVVIFTDNRVYHLQKSAKAGTSPHDTRYWGLVNGDLGEAILLMSDAINMAVSKAVSDVGNTVANNLTTTESGKILDARQGKVLKDRIEQVNPNTKELVLASSTSESTKTFKITVDDDGELTATEI